MARQFKFFMIPADAPEEAEEVMNRFLKENPVTRVRQELIMDGKNSFWCMAFEYRGNKGKTGGKIFAGKIDYRERLSEEDFALFAEIRASAWLPPSSNGKIENPLTRTLSRPPQGGEYSPTPRYE